MDPWTKCGDDAEEKAVANLIAEINSLDSWRDRVGRRIIALFLGTFAFAVGMLCYVAAYEGPSPIKPASGPKVHGVLQSMP